MFNIINVHCSTESGGSKGQIYRAGSQPEIKREMLMNVGNGMFQIQLLYTLYMPYHSKFIQGL